MKSLAIVALLAGSAAAFPTGFQFDSDPLTTDGAGGIAFTGAPRFSTHTCAVCHTNAPGTIGLRLEADHPELFTDGWVAGMQYQMRVVMLNEHEGIQYAAAGDNCGANATPYTPCDENGFALEMDDDTGAPIGKLVPALGTTCLNSGTIPTDVDARVLNDGTAVTHNGAHMAMTAWSFCWTAPAAGAGTITAFVAAVDGNGGNGTAAFPNDTTGDDVTSGAVALAEMGATRSGSGGCNAGGSGLVVGALVLVILRRRRKLAPLLVVASISCTHVRATERGTLARRNMKFAPDPAEDELDLHMQEAREGSSGGYGSSGGGCGCN